MGERGHFQPFGIICWVYKRPDQRNVDNKFEARSVEGIYVGRATSDNTCASVVHIPSKGTTSRAFVMTNNVVFGNRYLTAGKADSSSGGVLDSLPRAATTAELAPGNVVKLEKTCNPYVTIRLRNGSALLVSA